MYIIMLLSLSRASVVTCCAMLFIHASHDIFIIMEKCSVSEQFTMHGNVRIPILTIGHVLPVSVSVNVALIVM